MARQWSVPHERPQSPPSQRRESPSNFLLLRYADSSNDPVGKLTPRASITQPASPRATQTYARTDDGGEERDD
jgi:hypothetical protein